MSFYQGPAQLDADGQLIDGNTILAVHHSSRTWGGVFETGDDGALWEAFNSASRVLVRLPDGGEGVVVLERVGGGPGEAAAVLEGSGVPPKIGVQR